MFWRFNKRPAYRAGAGKDWRVLPKRRDVFNGLRRPKNLNWELRDVKNLYIVIILISLAIYLFFNVLLPLVSK